MAFYLPSFPGLQRQRGLYPGQVGAHVNIDTRHIRLPTANAPSDQSDHEPDAIVGANQGRATVSSAGILASLTAGTDEAGGAEGKVGAQAGSLQCRLAIDIGNQGHIHLAHDGLVGTSGSKIVLTPAGDPAALAHKCGGGQANCTHCGATGEGDCCCQLENGHIVLQIVGIEGGIDVHIADEDILRGNRLICAGCIPFPKAHLEGA